MELRSMFIAVLMVSALYIGMSSFFNSWGSYYGRPLDVSYLNRTAQLQASVDHIQGNQTSKLTGIPVLGSLVATLSGTVEFLIVIDNILIDAWTNMLGGFAQYLKLESWMTAIIGIAVLFTIVTGIASIIIRWKI